MIFLVTYCDLKKKAEVDQIENLKITLENIFSISFNDHHLYYFDDDFKDWVSVEEDYHAIPDRCKLMIKKIENLRFDAQVEDHLGDNSFMDRNQNDSNFTNASTSGLLDDNFPTTSTPSKASIEDSDLLAAARVWPLSYKMPAFHKSIEQDIKALSNEGRINIPSHLRKRVVQHLFEELKSYTWYPQTHQYNGVLQSMLRQYPLLKDKISPRGIFYSSWLQSLRQKFKRARPSMATSSKRLEMVQKYGNSRQKRQSTSAIDEGGDSDMDMRCKKSRISENLELVGEVEDAFSIDRHLKQLRGEMAKTESRRNNDLIRDRMLRTRSTRMHDVDEMSVADLQSKYPPLGTAVWIIEEMNSLVQKDCVKLLSETSHHRLYQNVKKQKLPADILNLTDKDEFTPSWLLTVPSLFHESYHGYITTNANPKSTYPVIRYEVEEGFIVMVDGCQVIGMDNLVDAVAVLLSAYWVFNIQYPNSAKHTLSFLSTHILHLDVEVTSKVLRFVNKL